MFDEYLIWGWMGAAIVFAIGGAVGFFTARQIKDKRTLELERQLEATQAQLNGYQEDVNRHFLKTSLLFNKLTDDYREVYEHLATGAQKLCKEQTLAPGLNLPETKILSADITAGATSDAETPSNEVEESPTIEPVAQESAEPSQTAEMDNMPEAQNDFTENETLESAATENTDANTENSGTESAEAPSQFTQNDENDENIHLGAESTPSVEVTRPAVH